MSDIDEAKLDGAWDADWGTRVCDWVLALGWARRYGEVMIGGFSGGEMTRRVGMLAALATWAIACGRVDKRDTAASVSSTNGITTSGVAASSSAGGVGSAPSSSEQFSLEPPAEFAGGAQAALMNAGQAGCVGLTKAGWLEVSCEGNTGDGNLVKASLALPNGETKEISPNADGTLRMLLPWQPHKQATARLERSRAAFDLTVNGTSGGFRRVLPAAQAEACAKLGNEHRDRLTLIRKQGQGSVRALDVRKFPKLGDCRASGKDAWALEIDELRATGESVDREVSLTLNVVHVAVDGKLTKAAWGPLVFAPGQLALPALSLFDYDGDGSAEAIIRHDILAKGERSLGKPPGTLPAVFTLSSKRVVPYAKADKFTTGGVVAEHLEGDERLDLGDYGPFIAWLGLNCGAGRCPERVVGPRFYRRSLPDGRFDGAASEARAALQTTCNRSRGPLVGDIEDATGKKRAALNVACARVRGESTESLLQTINQEKSRICGEASACQLHSVLAAWAKAQPPFKLVLQD